MKKLISFLISAFMLIAQTLFAQEYFVTTAVNINLPNQGGNFFEAPYFDFERISSSSDLLDIAISRLEYTNWTGQYNFNNGNGTYGNVIQFSTQGTGQFIGNLFVKLRSSTVLKDLVVGRSNGWEIHHNENGSITGVIQNYTNESLNGGFISSGAFNSSDSYDDVLFSNWTTQLYYFVNNMNGNLGGLNTISPAMPYSVSKFKLKQINEKGKGYIQYNPLDRVDIIYNAYNVTPNRLVVYKNNNNNGFDVSNPLANFEIDPVYNEIIDFEAADFNNDGFNDVVVTYKKNVCPSEVYSKVYINDNGFSLYQVWSTELFPYDPELCPEYRVSSADINKDGLNDLIFMYVLPANNRIYMKVFIADKNVLEIFTQSYIPYTIDLGLDKLPVLVQISVADIYGGNQTHHGGGIALIISCEVAEGGQYFSHYVKVINADPARWNSPPPPPIVQGLLEFDQGAGVWHPHLHLDYRGERDFDHYEIWKDKDGVGLERIVPYIQDTGWTDFIECVIVGGEDSPYWNVHYFAKAYDKTALLSQPSRIANYRTECIPICEGCGGDNPNPEPNHNQYNYKNNNNFRDNYSLSNYPNPFNPITYINYSLPEKSRVTVKIFDILGRLIVELVNENQDAGYYNVIFDGTNHASGLYICTMKTGEFSKVNKILLLK